MLKNLYNFSLEHNFVTSLIIMILSVCVYKFIKYIIKKQEEWSSYKKKHYISYARNLSIVSVIILLIFTWSGEIKAFIFSISAIGAGLMIVFKEVILSFFSYFIISSNQLFKIGDILEFDNKTGQVIDRSLIYTKIALLGPEEGKDLLIPNILFVTTKFINLSSSPFSSKYININTKNKRISYKKDYLENYLLEKQLKFNIFLDYITKEEIIFKIKVEDNSLNKLNFLDVKNDLIISFNEIFKNS